MTPQLPAPLPLARLKATQAIQPRDHRRARHRQQRRRPVQRLLALHPAEQEERCGARHDARLDDGQRVRAAHERALEQRRYQPDEAEEAPRVFRRVPEEVVRHEGEAEFHAREEEDEGEVRGVEEGVRVCAGALLLLHLPSLPLPFQRAAGCRRPLRRHRQRLRQAEIKIHRLGDDQQQREPRRRRKRIRPHALHSTKPRPERRPKRKRNRKARPHQRHGRAPLTLIADIRRDRHGQLHIPLAQPADDPARDEGPEVGRGNPQRDAQHVARHGPQQRGAPAIFIGQGADDGGRDGLEEGEERAEGAAEEHDVVAVVYGFCEGVFVRVEGGEGAGEEGGRGGGVRGFVVAVEFEELGEEREDEREGDLWRGC